MRQLRADRFLGLQVRLCHEILQTLDFCAQRVASSDFSEFQRVAPDPAREPASQLKPLVHRGISGEAIHQTVPRRTSETSTHSRRGGRSGLSMRAFNSATVSTAN